MDEYLKKKFKQQEKIKQEDYHLRILHELHDTYCKKNSDYGNSFSELYKQYGIISPMIKLEDKMSRLRSLIRDENKIQVKTESIEDTLMDLANYAIMTVQELRGDYLGDIMFDFDYSVLPKIVAVDFDGTLVKGATFPDIGDLNQLLYEELTNGEYKDYRKILLTNRSGSTLADAINWCEEHNLHFDAVNDNIEEVKDALCGGPIMKPWFTVLIDDKAMSIDEFEEKYTGKKMYNDIEDISSTESKIDWHNGAPIPCNRNEEIS
jgi:hypothetical protein